jgi:hypothetical protein
MNYDDTTKVCQAPAADVKPMLREPLTDRSAWTRADLEQDETWVHHFNSDELGEIAAAVGTAKERGLQPGAFSRDDFPLPLVSRRIARVIDELEAGRGCVLMRGLNPSHYSDDDLKILYWGLGVHLGEPVSQNAAGQRLGYVTDRGRDYAKVNVRGYTTSAELKMHCDAADIVTLLCVHHARSGGESLVTSSVSIHNELLAAFPEYLEPLYVGFHFDLRGEGSSGDPDEITHCKVPVFSYHAGRLSCRFNQRTIEDGMRKAGMPLAGRALAAVQAVGALARRPDLCYPMQFQPGDIQLLNNHSILHGRRAFEDFAEPQRRRLLMRMWINLDDGRPLDAAFANRLNTGPRGGVAVRGIDY